MQVITELEGVNYFPHHPFQPVGISYTQHHHHYMIAIIITIIAKYIFHTIHSRQSYYQKIIWKAQAALLRVNNYI